jgi:hypothetical protein
MKKLLWTFGIGTNLKGKCVITNCDDFMTAMQYVYDKYGQYNVSMNYPEPYFDIERMIEQNHYELIEEITL